MSVSAIRRRELPTSPWAALALIVVAQFMVILDVAIVNVALPSIEADLGFTQSGLEWVVTAYAIVFGGFLLLGGRLADVLGRRRVFAAGIALFAAVARTPSPAGAPDRGLCPPPPSVIRARSNIPCVPVSLRCF